MKNSGRLPHFSTFRKVFRYGKQQGNSRLLSIAFGIITPLMLVAVLTQGNLTVYDQHLVVGVLLLNLILGVSLFYSSLKETHFRTVDVIYKYKIGNNKECVGAAIFREHDSQNSPETAEYFKKLQLHFKNQPRFN